MRTKRIRVGDFILGKEEKQAIKDVIRSGRITEGKKTAEFEQMWRNYVGTDYCVATNSGNSALMMAFRSLQHLKMIGDTAITTPLTYIATSSSMMASGIKPIFADVDMDTFGITSETIKEAVEENKLDTKFVVPVHLFGIPTDIEKIKKEGYLVFEDACQAHGTIVNGKKAGSIGIGGAFSFYIMHALGFGEMGAVTTNEKDLYLTMKQVKVQGRSCNCMVCTRDKGFCPKLTNELDPRFTHGIMGWNLKTLDLVAALGVVKLKHIDEILKKRQDNVKYLNDSLPDLGFRKPSHSNKISYLLYHMICDPKRLNRDKLRMYLEKKGVETRPIYDCIPDQPAFSFLKKDYEGKLKNARYIAKNGFYIGIHEFLTEKDLEYIVKVFKQYRGKE